MDWWMAKRWRRSKDETWRMNGLRYDKNDNRGCASDVPDSMVMDFIGLAIYASSYILNTGKLNDMLIDASRRHWGFALLLQSLFLPMLADTFHSHLLYTYWESTLVELYILSVRSILNLQASQPHFDLMSVLLHLIVQYFQSLWVSDFDTSNTLLTSWLLSIARRYRVAHSQLLPPRWSEPPYGQFIIYEMVFTFRSLNSLSRGRLSHPLRNPCLHR